MGDERSVLAEDRLDIATAALVSGLRSIAPSDVVVGARRISVGDLASLFAVERAAVGRAVDSRRREFASGRALLRELVGERVAFAVAANRAPEFPAGVRGSLSHDAEFAVAAVTRNRHVHSVGVDIEPRVPLSTEMASVILRDDEAGLDAHLAFTLKEAAYKAWSGLGGRLLAHHDVRLNVAASTFSAEIIDDGVHVNGRFTSTADHHLALVVVRTSSSDVRRRLV